MKDMSQDLNEMRLRASNVLILKTYIIVINAMLWSLRKNSMPETKSLKQRFREAFGIEEFPLKVDYSKIETRVLAAYNMDIEMPFIRLRQEDIYGGSKCKD
jgi:hypothetical protein